MAVELEDGIEIMSPEEEEMEKIIKNCVDTIQALKRSIKIQEILMKGAMEEQKEVQLSLKEK